MSNARELAELSGSYGTGGFVGMKNRIINGDFNVVQRGASGTTTSSGYVSLDRWRASISVASTVTLSQQTFTPGQIDVPGDPEFFMRYDWLGTSPAATKNIMQRVENVKSLVGAAALSFYAKTELGDDVTVEVRQNFGSGGSSEVTVLSQSIDCTTGWNKFEIPINLPSLSGKTIGAGSYIEVSWKAVDGSNSYLDLARVQLEKGSTATSFDYRPYSTELALCQRYYQKSYEVGTVPGTATYVNAINTFGTAAASTAGTIGTQAFFRVDMRTTATISIWDASGNSGKVSANPYGSSVVANNSGTVINSGSNQIQVERGSGTACNGIIYHYAANAEL